MAPTIVMPIRLPRFLEPSSTLELGCHQAPTLSLVYSIVFSHILSLPKPVHIPVFQSCVSCVILCLLCYPVSPIPVYIALLCFHSLFPISPTLAMSLDFIYKTLIHVCIQHVLNIDFDYCSHCCYIP